jgi:hypothetical protein
MARLLMIGCRGDDVKQLQSLLNGQPPSVQRPLAVDGIFGPLTKARVEEYQRLNHLRVDGIAGPKTLGNLKKGVRIVLAQTSQFRFGAVSLGRFGLFAAPRMTLAAAPVAAVLGGGSQEIDLGVFAISDVPAMPAIDLEVKIDGISPDPTFRTFFDWVIDIIFVASESCSCGKSGVRFRDGFTVRNVLGGRFSPSFPWVRGGNLTLAARARVNTDWVETIFHARVVGTDPAWSAARTALGSDVMRRLSKHESVGGHQFEVDPNDRSKGIVPVFNRGRDGGVGLCQITPSDPVQKGNDAAYKDAVWNWQSNIDQGKEVFAAKRRGALGYLNQHRANGHFPNNGDPQGPGRVGSGVDDATVLLWETIQRFNGGTHWQWNATTNLWESKPQLNRTYVASVLAQTP